MADDTVPELPSRDLDEQQPVALAWRAEIVSIVSALVRGDYELLSAGSSVRRLSAEEADYIANNLMAYGGITLLDPPQETWETSVALWMGDHWEVVVDLWSAEEGRTDLILSLAIRDTDGAYEYFVEGVWVP